MKKLVLLVILISSSIFAQRSQKPWSNHVDYEKQHSIDVSKTLTKKIDISKFDNHNKVSSTRFSKVMRSSTTTKKNNSLINGINIAWVNFGRDVGKDAFSGAEYHPDLAKFGEIMDFTVSKGGNVVRWWYHTNGSTNPVFKNQKVIKNPEFFHEDVISILNLAQSKGLKVQICLWSFDMLKEQWGVDAVANKQLINKDEYTQAYIDNALLPLVNAVGNHAGLYGWEIFNEAEGMTNSYASHWPGFSEKVEMPAIQTFINKTSGAIRRAQPSVKITNGALGLLTNMEDSDKGFWNAYSDANLIYAGGDDDGYLDMYNVHYYSWAGVKGSPFHNNFDANKIDKKTVIGEYYPDNLSVGGTPTINASDLGNKIIENNWAGSLVWSWTDRTSPTDRNNMAAIITSLSEYIPAEDQTDTDNSNEDSTDDDSSGGEFVNTIEAENSNLEGAADVLTNNSASNQKYVQLAANPSIVNFKIDGVPSLGTYLIRIRNRSFEGNDQFGPKTQQIVSSANNTMIGHVFDPSKDWKIDTVQVTLKEGLNTVSILADWGYMDVDKIDLDLITSSEDENAGEDLEDSIEEVSDESTEGIVLEGGYYLQSYMNSQNLIVVSGNDGNVRMDDPSVDDNQKWLFEHLGNRVYSIQNKETNQYLEVRSSNCFNGADVSTWDSVAGDNIQWEVLNMGDGVYTLKPLHCLSRALDRSGGEIDADAHLWDYNSENNNQKWRLIQENNRSSRSSIASIHDLNMYPNPANETLVIEGIHKGDQITIYNLFGIVVLNHVAIMDKELLNVSSLMSGMYQIHISGYRNTKSFIKK